MSKSTFGNGTIELTCECRRCGNIINFTIGKNTDVDIVCPNCKRREMGLERYLKNLIEGAFNEDDEENSSEYHGLLSIGFVRRLMLLMRIKYLEILILFNKIIKGGM